MTTAAPPGLATLAGDVRRGLASQPRRLPGTAPALPGTRLGAGAGIARQPAAAADARVVSLLGSTLGRLAPGARRRRLFDLDCHLQRGDRLLADADLTPAAPGLAARYRDQTTAVAADQRRLVASLNRSFGGNLEPAGFTVDVGVDDRGVALGLRAQRAQTVQFCELGVTAELEAGEVVVTARHRVFTPEGFEAELYAAGFVIEESWRDGDEYLVVRARTYC